MSDGWIILGAAGVGAAPALATFIIQHRFERLRYKDDKERQNLELARRVAQQTAQNTAEARALRLGSYKFMIDALAQRSPSSTESRKLSEAMQRAQADVLIYGSPEARTAVLAERWDIDEVNDGQVRQKETRTRQALIDILNREANPGNVISWTEGS